MSRCGADLGFDPVAFWRVLKVLDERRDVGA